MNFVNQIIQLVEAERTTEDNFMPPEIRDLNEVCFSELDLPVPQHFF